MNPLINGLFSSFKETQELGGMSDSDAFELFSGSLALDESILDQTQLTDLLLDPGTPGVDMVIIQVNGDVLNDESDVDELASSSNRLDVHITFLQAKNSASVDTTEILNIRDIVQRFLEGETFPLYPKIDKLSSVLGRLWSQSGRFRARPTVDVYFVTIAGARAFKDEMVVNRISEAEDALSSLEFIENARFYGWGSDDLYSAWSASTKANSVEISLEKQVNLPEMPSIDQAILGAISLEELFKMITESDGNLNEKVFYDNVRGFQGVENNVNKKIIETLEGEDSNLLMVLNNGITVVAEAYSPKPGDKIELAGYQIVNGCQTSYCLYESSEIREGRLDSLFLPVKVVVTSDENVASQITQATNSQTAVTENDLIALTQFQKQLEEFYRLDPERVGLTYERRRGQFYGRDIVKKRTVPITDQLRSISAIALRVPHTAAGFPANLFGEVKDDVFKSGHQYLPYVASAFASYKLENAFRAGVDARYRSIRYHLLMTFAFQVNNGWFEPLNSRKADAQAKKIIKTLKADGLVDKFNKAALTVIDAAGGEIPSKDRLKRAQFTNDLKRHLLNNVKS